jgi:hypothetical protein
MMKRLPLTHILSTCLLSCNQVAASRLQIVPDWPTVACKLYPTGRQLHENCAHVASSRIQISVAFIHVACDWRPLGYHLYATGGHSGTIFMRLAVSHMQILHALAASCV